MVDKPKNRLKNTRVYLCGAMDRVADGGVEWRDWITPMLEEFGCVVYNPCKKPFILNENTIEDIKSRRLRSELKKAGKYQEVREIMREVRNSDLRMVDYSDFIIVHLDTDVHACGTYEEIAVAGRSKKPVLVICKQGVSNIPDWLFAQIEPEMFFATFYDVLAYLKKIDDIDIPPKRWYFYS